jgi:hypothetical protein
MSKLTRVYQRLFGSTAPSTQIGKFGSLAAGSTATTNDPTQVQSLSNWLDGWFAAVLGNNSPCIEDMNAVHFVLAYQLGYIFQAGVPEWDATTIYYKGSLVNAAGLIYVSLSDSNTNHAVTDNTNWRILNANLTQVSADYTTLITDDVVEMDATAGNKNVTLLAASSAKFKRQTIVKTDSSTHKVTISDGTLTKVLYGKYNSITVFSNGSAWYVLSDKIKATSARAAEAAGSVSAATPIVFPTVDYDTTSSYNPSTGRFTCPEDGFYLIQMEVDTANSGVSIGAYKNGSLEREIGVLSSDFHSCNGSIVVNALAGDLLDIRPVSGITVVLTDSFVGFTLLK